MKQPFDQNTWESAVANLRDEVEHDVALGGAQPREVHASERPQVLPCDGPGPQSLDVVEPRHSVHEESATEPARRVQPGEAAVQRMKRQPSKEVTTMVSQAVMKV